MVTKGKTKNHTGKSQTGTNNPQPKLLANPIIARISF
jgi:hypothetical protein